MILLRCRVLGFGRLSDRSLDFREGLNVVFAPNEAGKSTLQRFIIGMLYGQLRADLRAQRRPDPWVEAYKPWGGAEYGGQIVCRLAAGAEMEIRRSFGREDARVEIRTATGEEVTRRYEQLRNGDVLFARTHLGLSKDLFESVAVIRESRAGDLDGRDSIRDRIASLAQVGDEDLSIRQSLERLESAIDSIGSDRAPTRPYRLAQDRLQDLQAEKQALESRRREFETQVEARRRLTGRIAEAEAGLRTARAAAAAARWNEAVEKVRMLEELQSEIAGLRASAGALGGRADFPAHQLEALDRLVGARDALAPRLEAARLRAEEASRSLGRAEEARSGLEAYAALDPEVDAHLVTEWSIRWHGAGFRRDDAQKTLERLAAETDSLKRHLAAMGGAFADPAVDWERRAVENAETERAAGEHTARIMERIAQRKAELSLLRSRTLRSIWGTILTLVGAFLSVAWWRQFHFWPALVPACALVAAFAALGMRARRWRSAQAPVAAEIVAREAEHERLRRDARQKHEEMDRAMVSSGFSSINQFLVAADEAEQVRRRIAELEQRRLEIEEQRQKAAAEAADLLMRLQETLAKVDLTCAPATLKSRVDVFRERLRRFRDLEQEWRARRKELEEAGAGREALEAEQAALEADIRRILDQAGVAAVDDFKRGCDDRVRLLDMKAKESAGLREYSRLSGGISLDQWRDRLRAEAEQARLADALPSQVARNGAMGNLALPYAPSPQEAEEEERRAAAALASLREEYARVAERVEGAFGGCRPLSDIEEDLAQAEEEARRLALNRRALELALETVRQLSREQQEVLAPRLNLLVEDRFRRLSRGRYAEVRIDLDFNVRVREPAAADLRSAASLSRGTQDQLYLALRFAVLEMLSGEAESCPALLDEPFAAYDPERLEEAFRVLRDEAGRRQLILFTCRPDVREQALLHGASPTDLIP